MYEVDLGMAILRVVAGITLALHGINKFRGSLSGLAGWFDSIGMRPGRFNATMAASSETFGGLLLALGLLTPFAALAMVGTMTVAGWIEHREHFFILDNGFEYVMIMATHRRRRGHRRPRQMVDRRRARASTTTSTAGSAC